MAEARKVVTVLFSDVVESTELGGSLDPESVRELMTRYFDAVRPIVERHGGMLEKFIGDAVMAVFGVPRAHEDDALRAVRAAFEMRQALAQLNESFEQTWGVTVEARIGINTGEVIAGDPSAGHSFVAGDTVNTAARLEQNAQAGEILLGDPTYRLVRSAVVAEDAGPLELKGKPAPVRAFRLLEVDAEGPGWTRRLDSPLVGRERELELLREVFGRVEGTQRAEIATLMGPAGVGKSRLSTELLARLGERAAAISGRCLPYGEGITFWPLATALRDAAGIGGRDRPEEARRKIAALVAGAADGDVVAERLSAVVGADSGTPGIQETFAAVRRLFEHLASERPLVVVFDDIQWAEETFLDLLEYLVHRITAPVLILCLARPELLEVRGAWMVARPDAALVTLHPLGERDVDGLIRNLVGGGELVEPARSRIAAVAEGNPLFVEEVLRMLVDDGLLRRDGDTWTLGGEISELTIPPTIHALVTARLDRLEPEEQTVTTRAAVVGRVFWWDAVSELSPPELEPAIAGYLQSLIRKELVEPDYAEADRDSAFRFTHIVIRDAAYGAIPKGERAGLHERLADWLERDAHGIVGDYDELVGYHLEQAARLRLELGPANEQTETLGRRASALLGSAGRRAFVAGDMPAAAKLLRRAAALRSSADRERAELLIQLAFALFETGDLAALQEVVDETTETARASGDASLTAYASILGLWISLSWETEGWADRAEHEATKTLAAFEAAGDDRGLAKAWALLGLVQLERAQFGPAAEAWEKSAEHARRAGDRRDELESLAWVPLAVWAGPVPAEAGLERVAALHARAGGDAKLTASALVSEGAFAAGGGRFDEARSLVGRAKAILDEAMLAQWLAGPVAQLAGSIELLAGDAQAAERELRRGYDTLTEIGELSWLSTTAALLAEAVYQQGRHDEALALAQASEERAGAEDAYSHALIRSVRAKVAASAPLAEEAVALADRTDFLNLRWQVRMSAAEVLTGARRRAVVEEAVRLAEEKGFPVAAEQARGLLD